MPPARRRVRRTASVASRTRSRAPAAAAAANEPQPPVFIVPPSGAEDGNDEEGARPPGDDDGGSAAEDEAIIARLPPKLSGRQLAAYYELRGLAGETPNPAFDADEDARVRALRAQYEHLARAASKAHAAIGAATGADDVRGAMVEHVRPLRGALLALQQMPQAAAEPWHESDETHAQNVLDVVRGAVRSGADVSVVAAREVMYTAVGAGDADDPDTAQRRALATERYQYAEQRAREYDDEVTLLARDPDRVAALWNLPLLDTELRVVLQRYLDRTWHAQRRDRRRRRLLDSDGGDNNAALDAWLLYELRAHASRAFYEREFQRWAGDRELVPSDDDGNDAPATELRRQRRREAALEDVRDTMRDELLSGAATVDTRAEPLQRDMFAAQMREQTRGAAADDDAWLNEQLVGDAQTHAAVVRQAAHGEEHVRWRRANFASRLVRALAVQETGAALDELRARAAAARPPPRTLRVPLRVDVDLAAHPGATVAATLRVLVSRRADAPRLGEHEDADGEAYDDPGRVRDTPLHFEWLHNGTRVESHRYAAREHAARDTYTVGTRPHEDPGQYTCRVRVLDDDDGAPPLECASHADVRLYGRCARDDARVQLDDEAAAAARATAEYGACRWRGGGKLYELADDAVRRALAHLRRAAPALMNELRVSVAGAGADYVASLDDVVVLVDADADAVAGNDGRRALPLLDVTPLLGVSRATLRALYFDYAPLVRRAVLDAGGDAAAVRAALAAPPLRWLHQHLDALPPSCGNGAAHAALQRVHERVREAVDERRRAEREWPGRLRLGRDPDPPGALSRDELQRRYRVPDAAFVDLVSERRLQQRLAEARRRAHDIGAAADADAEHVLLDVLRRVHAALRPRNDVDDDGRAAALAVRCARAVRTDARGRAHAGDGLWHDTHDAEHGAPHVYELRYGSGRAHVHRRGAYFAAPSETGRAQHFAALHHDIERAVRSYNAAAAGGGGGGDNDGAVADAQRRARRDALDALVRTYNARAMFAV